MNGAPNEARAGLLAAAGACILWGVLPLYVRALREVPAMELLSWRVLLTAPAAAGAVLLLREQGTLALLRAPRLWGMLALSAALIGINWGVYVWAVMQEQVLQAALGYFLNPLVNIALGVAFLKERLSRAQLAAVVLAGGGVAVQAVGVGGLPWVTLALAFSFAFYTLVRKRAAVGPALGLLVESALLAPIAGLALLLFAGAQQLELPALGASVQLLMLAAGVLTAAPLVLFAFGAQRLTMATLGLLQYLAPTMQFGIALILGEPFTHAHALSMALICAGLAISTTDMLRRRRAAFASAAAAKAS
jgi:chloramphenicol-sensitive protein RarD